MAENDRSMHWLRRGSWLLGVFVIASLTSVTWFIGKGLSECENDHIRA